MYLSELFPGATVEDALAQTGFAMDVSRAGLLASAVMIPLVGVGGIFVGMYMKLNHPEIDAGSALPLFILEKRPLWRRGPCWPLCW